jgi:CheY-like chemotaxis protein
MSSSAEDVARCLEVGRAAVLQPVTEDGKGKFRIKGFIRGWQRGRYVLLDVPTRDLPTNVRPEVPCVVRFLNEGTACGFRATVLDTRSVGHEQYVRVTWPAEISFSRVRRHERVEVSIPCKATNQDGLEISATILDLSFGGCRIEFAEGVVEGDALALCFVLPDASVIDGLRVSCRNVAGPTGRHSAGCVFSDGQDASLQDINFYVTTTLDRMRGQVPSLPRVLIIERNARVVRFLQGWFEQRGYEAVVSSEGVDGIFLLRMSRPDAMLVNVAFPGLPGPEICRTVKASERFKDLTVLAYGEESEEQRRRALDAGASFYISAGDDVQRISQAISEHLDMDGAGSKAAEEKPEDEVREKPAPAPAAPPPAPAADDPMAALGITSDRSA